MTSVRRDYFKEGREFVTLTLIAKNNLGHQKENMCYSMSYEEKYLFYHI